MRKSTRRFGFLRFLIHEQLCDPLDLSWYVVAKAPALGSWDIRVLRGSKQR